MEATWRDRQKQAYKNLENVVQALSDLEDERDRDEGQVVERNTPTAWVLVVGFDSITEDFEVGAGMVAIYPRDGMQPVWKTKGLLVTAHDKHNER